MIFLLLILAHLLGDFVFQPSSWVVDKEQKKIKSKFLYYHILIHTVLMFICLWSFQIVFPIIIIALSHFIIDCTKLYLQNTVTKKLWFFIDQSLHLGVIVAVYLYCQSAPITVYLNDIFTENTLKIITGFVFLSFPCSIFIKMLINTWTPETKDTWAIDSESLQNAGKYIGILERFLVYIFILVNHWEGVGFMIAAKSIFRFSDLAQARQRKLTEYVLIGTLLSFGMAILTGILVKL